MMDEINPVALGITAIMGAIIYYGMFIVDGVQAIPLATRVIGFIAALPAGYFFAVYLIERG